MSRVSKVSNFVKKSSHGSETFDLKSERKKKPSSRNPLKDLNSISSSNSSNSSSSSLPIEAPRGCLSFVLSNSSSKSPLYRYKNLPQTPKSAPNPGHSQFRPKPAAKQRPSGGGAISGNVEKSKRSSCFYQWQNNKKRCFRANRHPNPAPDLDGHVSRGVTELIPGVCLKEEALREKKQVNTSEYSDSRLLRAEVDLKEEGTPVNKLAQGSGLDSTPGKSIEEESTRTANRTPPVQASISPEIQCESSVVSTPTCFGAGHVLSGVTDKRKCRPRGFLTVREESVLCKDGALDGIGHSDVAGHLNISRVSLVPVPTEASVQWLLPPCVEEGEDYKARSIKSSPESGSLQGFRSPSSSSRHGFSSDACSISDSESTATATTFHGREKRSHLVSPIEFPKYGDFVGPMSTVSHKSHSSDHANGCSSSSMPVPSSTTSNHEDGLSQEAKGYQNDRGRKDSPFSWDSLGSGNVMCTPELDSSPVVIRFGLSWMDGDNHQEHQLELDSMVDILHNTHLSPQSQISMWGVSDVPSLPASSAHFSLPVTPLNSVDWSHIQKPSLNDLTADLSCSSFENASQSQMRISWRDGLVSRVFEMEESNCSCGFSYEEQEAAVNCYDNDQMKSDLNHEVSELSRENLPLSDCLKPLESSYEENASNGEDKVKILPGRPSSCAESISTDGGGLVTSNDSDWLCFKNKLFE